MKPREKSGAGAGRPPAKRGPGARKKGPSGTRRAGSSRSGKGRDAPGTGRLRIGDSWNAITIIALSQNNPLKAIAEFVENSIDAQARSVTIVRGREKGQLYLRVIDDGQGIPLNEEGVPNFTYVATHICDSIKKKLKQEGAEGIQGEFGIGLLSFWTVGERLVLSSAGRDGRTYRMEMKKGEPGYTITAGRSLFPHPGTELLVHPLLAGLRQLSGERIQHYLASELRNRIRRSGVRIFIKDRPARKELEVRPQQFSGRPLRGFQELETALGPVYLELYLNNHAPENTVGLYRSGTRVLPSITRLEAFDREPWSSGYFQGMIDAPFLQLTPGTRDGIVHDGAFTRFCEAVASLEPELVDLIEAEKRAEEEESNRHILRSVQRALKEAFLALPRGEYDWLDILSGRGSRPAAPSRKEDAPLLEAGETARGEAAGDDGREDRPEERRFFERAGPLYKAMISPASCFMQVTTQRKFRCIPRDRRGRLVEENVRIRWKVQSGEGRLLNPEGEYADFQAPEEPGITTILAEATQNESTCTAQSIVTVTTSLLEQGVREGGGLDRGIPGYTFVYAPGELWRSRYDDKNNLIIINNGHKDYVYASRKKARKLKYICRLYAKELVLVNFPGFDVRTLLERMVELTLYTEEHLH
jgi:hypothetical protein